MGSAGIWLDTCRVAHERAERMYTYAQQSRVVRCWRRYDVEMFQKVEALTGLRMDKYECEADAALLLLERTTEAQQMAAMQARAKDQGRGCLAMPGHSQHGLQAWAVSGLVGSVWVFLVSV